MHLDLLFGPRLLVPASFLAVLLSPRAGVAQSSSAVPDRASLQAYCKKPSSAKLAACSLLLRGGCQFSGGDSKPHCTTLAILDALCKYDNPSDAQQLCTPYQSFCSANGSACTADPDVALPSWTNSSVIQNQIKRMCDFHNMVRPHACGLPRFILANFKRMS